MANEAECMIYTLIPFLKYSFPDVKDIQGYFTESCQQCCIGFIYDEVTKQESKEDSDIPEEETF